MFPPCSPCTSSRILKRSRAYALAIWIVVCWAGLHKMFLRASRPQPMPVDQAFTNLNHSLGEHHCKISHPLRCVGYADKVFIASMQYASSQKGEVFRFLVSLHDPEVDRVISKGIVEGLFGPKDRYPSVDEVHSICESTSPLYSIQCSEERVFVEVGSAIGMVSLYAAARGMLVRAFDPLPPNVQRFKESLCLNRCKAPNNATRFSPSRVSMAWSLVGARTENAGVLVESEPGNLAATMRGGGDVRSLVRMVTLDDAVDAGEIELMLLTCQGFELDALLGASRLLASGGIRNIIWRRHHAGVEHDAKAARIVQLLAGRGYRFFNIEGCKLGAPPTPIPSDQAQLLLCRLADCA